jgi:K+-transporting ATPase A subunit
MKTAIKRVLPALLMLASSTSFAQNAEMADTFRADGKIYVVVTIVLMVLAGLIGYLFLLDRKITRVERLLKEKRQN